MEMLKYQPKFKRAGVLLFLDFSRGFCPKLIEIVIIRRNFICVKEGE
ncbi:hypothetical protein PRVXT_001075 [Proteinivorax tanatarense]|uniref:Uncharacterized protein n=1 Tax=Proteinivorax tanatarense TaxID=1260629 RepID=A0AAU7VQC1_9FIRM